MADQKNLKVLNVEARENTGKGCNRRLRAKGLVPAVYYAADGTNKTIQADYKSLEKIYAEVGRTTVFQIKLGDKMHPALFWDIKRDPCKNTFSHIDFYGVDLEKPVKVVVPVFFEGTPKGTKIGGEMVTYFEKVTLMAKPLDMPSKIVIDVANLGLNESIKVADLALPEGVSAVYDNNFTIVGVIVPESDAADADAAGEAAK